MERILVNSWNEAKTYKDHTDRYQLAFSLIKPGAVVLDAACGVGYGTAQLASHPQVSKVFGIDISFDAISHAIKVFQNPKIDFQRKNLDDNRRLFNFKFDLFVCFKTLEHLINDRDFLQNLNFISKPDSKLILSIPNEEMFPLDSTPNPFHYRHYTVPEITNLLKETGFFIEESYCQRYFDTTSEIKKESNYLSNLFVCKKK